MEIKVTVRNQVPFPEHTEDYLQKKLVHLEHFSNQERFTVEAIFLEERYLKVCELLAKLKGKEMFVRVEAEDFNQAIDRACQKLKNQMETYFQKKIDAKRRVKSDHDDF